MFSGEVECPPSETESENPYFQGNSFHTTIPLSPQSGINTLPILSDDRESDKRRTLSDIKRNPPPDLKEMHFQSLPDITQIFGCFNRVINLSKTLSPPINPHPLKSNTDIIVVIPAYNEELTIGMVILLSLQHAKHVIVVDDGSQDRTGEISRLAGAEVISYRNNHGKIHAIQIGMKRAREIGFTAVVTIDGNGLYNPHEIPYISALILEGEADVVIGSRFLRNPNVVSSYQFTGIYPGFIAFNQKAIDMLVIPKGYPREPDVFQFFSDSGLEVADLPVSVRKKKHQHDKVKKVIIAMPAFNEEKNLHSVIKGALRYSNTVLVVDDGSSDNTALVAEEAGAIVVRHKQNQGYGAALNTIFSTARSMGTDALVIIDSDGQHNPTDIIKFMKKLEEGADVVVGSRFLHTGNTIPLYRQAGMKVLDFFTTAAGVKKISDSQSGFRAYGKKAINVLSLCGNGMSAGSEILIQISDNNMKVEEVPITVSYDIDDTSTHNPILHGISVLSNIFALINFRNPIIIFGIPAFILISVGIVVLYLGLYMRDVVTLPHLFLNFIWVTLIVTGSIIGCEGYIYHHYINKMKKK